MVTVNSSIVLIALPNIFRGIGINPLQPGNTTILLWMMMGFMVVTAVLVVSFGRLGDMFGRVRMFNMGFAIFSLFSILLSVSWLQGDGGRLVPDHHADPAGHRRRDAVRQLERDPHRRVPGQQARHGPRPQPGRRASPAASSAWSSAACSARSSWRLVFLVSVPFGIFGTVWSYLKLRELGVRKPAKLDLGGNLTFAAGLIAVLVGITYGIQPYGSHVMGWTSPLVISLIGGGLVVLAIFCFIETRVAEPMFRLSLFRIRAFTAATSPRCCPASAAAA